jgi:hypothetical protein
LKIVAWKPLFFKVGIWKKLGYDGVGNGLEMGLKIKKSFLINQKSQIPTVYPTCKTIIAVFWSKSRENDDR